MPLLQLQNCKHQPCRDSGEELLPPPPRETPLLSPLRPPPPLESLLTRPSQLQGFVRKTGPLHGRWWRHDLQSQRDNEMVAWAERAGSNSSLMFTLANDGVTQLPRPPEVVFPHCQIWVVRGLPLTCCLTCHTNLHLSHRPAPRRPRLASLAS